MADILILLLIFGGVAAFYLLALKKGWLPMDRMNCGWVPFDKRRAQLEEDEHRKKMAEKRKAKANRGK